MILYWRRYGKAGGCQIKIKIFHILIGGVAQLGEHLPCKQGVKSSNLSISICWSDQKEEAYAETLEETEAYQTYLENRILNKNELYILNQNIKTSEAIQEIVWKKQTCKCESVYENLEPKRPTLWTFGGPAATRGGKSFG